DAFLKDDRVFLFVLHGEAERVTVEPQSALYVLHQYHRHHAMKSHRRYSPENVGFILPRYGVFHAPQNAVRLGHSLLSEKIGALLRVREGIEAHFIRIARGPEVDDISIGESHAHPVCVVESANLCKTLQGEKRL